MEHNEISIKMAESTFGQSIKETGLYFSTFFKRWEVWEVKDGNATLIGWSLDKLSKKAAISLWSDFMAMRANRINSVNDICYPEEIQ